MIRYESKNNNQKDICLKEIGLSAQHMLMPPSHLTLANQ
jgi:hypothetical protein